MKTSPPLPPPPPPRAGCFAGWVWVPVAVSSGALRAGSWEASRPVLCGALRAWSWGPVAVPCPVLCGALLAGSCGPAVTSCPVLCGALRCFAGWVSRRLRPCALRCWGQSPSHARCFAVLCEKKSTWFRSRDLWVMSPTHKPLSGLYDVFVPSLLPSCSPRPPS